MTEVQKEAPTYIEEQPEQKRTRKPKPPNPDARPRGRPKWNPDSIHYDPVKSREYHKDYYHAKLKYEIKCPCCDAILLSKISLNQHLKVSKRCEIARLKHQLQMIGEDILKAIN